MKIGERIVTGFFMSSFYIKAFLRKVKLRIWYKRILPWWHRLYIREDEFDHSLDINYGAMIEMNNQEREKYLRDLFKRREIAHQKDLSRF